MKSKVGAIKISIIAIIVSFIFYIECQTNFHVCYMILRSIVHIINVMMEKSNMTDSYLFYKGRDIYAWLLNQPGSVEIKCIEMISSGVFGSTIVTLMVYYVEYKIQLKDAIHELINIQKKHVEQLNNLTYVSAFIDDENDIKRKTYLEYSENSLKLRGKERLEKQLNGRKNLSKAEKRKILNSNSQRLFQFQHKYDKKYRELVWTSIPKEKKEIVMEEVDKNAYLYNAIEELFFQTDFELIAAYFDYKDILEKDLFNIEKLSEDIYFLSFTAKRRKKKEKLVNEAICLDKRYVALIQVVLGDSFAIQDIYDYFRGNRKNLLHNIEELQAKFFSENLEETYAAREYKKWYVKIKKEILKESPDLANFKKPKNTFEIYGSGYALSPDFLRKVKIQDWDYHKYARSDLNKMGYKIDD